MKVLRFVFWIPTSLGFIFFIIAFFLQSTGKFNFINLIDPMSILDRSKQDSFSSDIIKKINLIKSDDLKVEFNKSLQDLLVKQFNSCKNFSEVNLEKDLIPKINKKFPDFNGIEINISTGKNRKSIISNCENWLLKTETKYNLISTLFFQQEIQMGAIVVIANKLPYFSIQKINEGYSGVFYYTCPHCNEHEVFDHKGVSETWIPLCSNCKRPITLVATTSSGKFKNAVEFLTPIKWNDEILKTTANSSKGKVLEIWRKVADRCTYQYDFQGSNLSENWKDPIEMWNLKKGDCEDSSILLASLLKSIGFDVRVVIGYNTRVGDHAWVTVKIDNQQYILESTIESNVVMNNLIKIEDGYKLYKPNILFDDHNVYFVEDNIDKSIFSKDCFSKDIWKPIPEISSKGEVSKKKVTLIKLDK